MAKMSNVFREAVAIAGTGQGAWISLHDDDPGTTGANEISGGSPAYTREQTTWTGGASDGSVSGSEVQIDVPGGTYTHIGCWTAQTGGTFLWGTAINSVTFPGQGILKVTPTVQVPQGS